MPLIPGKGHVGDNIREFRTGPKYRAEEESKGKSAAEKQALAVALSEQDRTEDNHSWATKG